MPQNIRRWSREERSARAQIFDQDRMTAPLHVLEDRDRRAGLELTPNQAILGDPVSGQSALDQRAAPVVD
jgi:hypothetical protein